jgi:5-methylcytosine-specific restriction endonuclease McrA
MARRNDVSNVTLMRRRFGTTVSLNEERNVLVELREKCTAMTQIGTPDARRRWMVRVQFLKNEEEDTLDLINQASLAETGE